MGYFYIIPAELAEGNNPRKALLYGLIVSLANKNGYASALNTFIADKLKIKSSRVRELLSELEKEGWIKIINRTSRKRKIYISSKFGAKNSEVEEETIDKKTADTGRDEQPDDNNTGESQDNKGWTIKNTPFKKIYKEGENPPEKLAGSEATQQKTGGLPAKKVAGIYIYSNINEYNNNRPPGAVSDSDPLSKIPNGKELSLKDYITIFYEHYKKQTGEKFVFSDVEVRFLKLLLKKLKTREKFETIIKSCLSDTFWGPQISPRILYSKLNYFLTKHKFKQKTTVPGEYNPAQDKKAWTEAGFVTVGEMFGGEK